MNKSKAEKLIKAFLSEIRYANYIKSLEDEMIRLEHNNSNPILIAFLKLKCVLLKMIGRLPIPKTYLKNFYSNLGWKEQPLELLEKHFYFSIQENNLYGRTLNEVVIADIAQEMVYYTSIGKDITSTLHSFLDYRKTGSSSLIHWPSHEYYPSYNAWIRPVDRCPLCQSVLKDISEEGIRLNVLLDAQTGDTNYIWQYRCDCSSCGAPLKRHLEHYVGGGEGSRGWEELHCELKWENIGQELTKNEVKNTKAKYETWYDLDKELKRNDKIFWYLDKQRQIEGVVVIRKKKHIVGYRELFLLNIGSS